LKVNRRLPLNQVRLPGRMRLADWMAVSSVLQQFNVAKFAGIPEMAQDSCEIRYFELLTNS
jgi:hypothetical protein